MVRYLQLAHNFGRGDSVTRETLARLVASVSKFLYPPRRRRW
ncbi:hypothetical protein OH799_16420 [Nocardia sp. NBC_00881]|nr:hypothetical protein OH799_16420 [Nocardia sp. NBC_00881]